MNPQSYLILAIVLCVLHVLMGHVADQLYCQSDHAYRQIQIVRWCLVVAAVGCVVGAIRQ